MAPILHLYQLIEGSLVVGISLKPMNYLRKMARLQSTGPIFLEINTLTSNNNCITHFIYHYIF